MYTAFENILDPPAGSIAIARGWRGDGPRPRHSQGILSQKDIVAEAIDTTDAAREGVGLNQMQHRKDGHALQFPLQRQFLQFSDCV
jgi:hypothetical protein